MKNKVTWTDHKNLEVSGCSVRQNKYALCKVVPKGSAPYFTFLTYFQDDVEVDTTTYFTTLLPQYRSKWTFIVPFINLLGKVSLYIS